MIDRPRLITGRHTVDFFPQKLGNLFPGRPPHTDQHAVKYTRLLVHTVRFGTVKIVWQNRHPQFTGPVFEKGCFAISLWWLELHRFWKPSMISALTQGRRFNTRMFRSILWPKPKRA